MTGERLRPGFRRAGRLRRRDRRAKCTLSTPSPANLSTSFQWAPPGCTRASQTSLTWRIPTAPSRHPHPRRRPLRRRVHRTTVQGMDLFQMLRMARRLLVLAKRQRTTKPWRKPAQQRPATLRLNCSAEPRLRSPHPHPHPHPLPSRRMGLFMLRMARHRRLRPRSRRKIRPRSSPGRISGSACRCASTTSPGRPALRRAPSTLRCRTS